MSDKKYSLFIPPANIVNKVPNEWTNGEAKEYLEWLLQIHVERVNGLLAYFAENLNDAPEEVLDRIGAKIAKTLQTEEFSCLIDGKPKLTNKGYALAADIGLLVADFILQKYYPVVTWKIVTRPKSDIDFHKPVLTNIGHETFDPIRVSIANAIDILKGHKQSDIWKTTYMYCKEAIEGEH
ncbi:MAG TPA: hypothetical protein VI298_01490 [Geobacteraceae bacterium]